MKIALLGYGKMGRMIEEAAIQRGHQITARLSNSQWENDAILSADLCMEFSRPDCVLDNIMRVARLKKPLIIGTTGWEDHINTVSKIIAEENIGAIYSPNFSLGMHLFQEIVNFASLLLNHVPSYDVTGIEHHHNQKKDKPSGSAKELSKLIEKNMDRGIDFSSVRCGSILGTHSILFDSPFDSITLTHDVKKRDGFAMGAILAAEWLQDKKGLYSYRECIQAMIKGWLL